MLIQIYINAFEKANWKQFYFIQICIFFNKKAVLKKHCFQHKTSVTSVDYSLKDIFDRNPKTVFVGNDPGISWVWHANFEKVPYTF